MVSYGNGLQQMLFKGILRSFKDWEVPIIQAIIQPYSMD